jgi:hypothetical protein
MPLPIKTMTTSERLRPILVGGHVKYNIAFTIGPRGRRATLGLPGTGLFGRRRSTYPPARPPQCRLAFVIGWQKFPEAE